MSILFMPDLAQKAKDGEKTQTRRIVRPSDVAETEDGKIVAVYTKDKNLRRRLRWAVGQEHAIVPGRGKFGIGRLCIASIERDTNTRKISEADCKAEGLIWYGGFIPVWCGMHDPMIRDLTYYDGWHWKFEKKQYSEHPDACVHGIIDMMFHEFLATRPAALYDAWKLTFAPV